MFTAKLVNDALADFGTNKVYRFNPPIGTATVGMGVTVDRNGRPVVVGYTQGGTGANTWSLAWIVRLLDGGTLDKRYYTTGINFISVPNAANPVLNAITDEWGLTTVVGSAKTSAGNEAFVARLFDEVSAADFKPTGENPPWVNGYLAGRIALAAYTNEEGTDDGDLDRAISLDRLGFENPLLIDRYLDADGEIERASTPALVVETPKVIIVGVMGTREGENIWRDMQFVKKPYQTGHVHNGFLISMKQILPQVREEVAARLAAGPGRKVWLAGHSLGGAAATLLAHELSKPSAGVSPPNTPAIPIQGVITFGQPRVGTAAWSDGYSPLLGAKTHRFTRNHDPVPSVPFNSLGFEHVGKHHFIHFDASDPGDPAIPTPGKVGVRFDHNKHQTYGLGHLLDDHAIVKYFWDLLRFMPPKLR
jgi:hypothetical protein